MDHARAYNRFLHEQLRGWAGESRRILDFGAGAGRFARLLARDGFEVEAIEPDAELRRRIAEAGVPVASSLAAVENEDFDAIYSINVLEHVEQDARVLVELFDRLRPGGSLFVYVPAFEVLFSSHDARVGHHRRYRRRDLVEKLDRAGFEIERADYVDCVGFFAGLAYKWVGSREGDLSVASVRAYDRFVFPISRWLDRWAGRWFGKNLLVVGRRRRRE